jgi:hypothetical protein
MPLFCWLGQLFVGPGLLFHNIDVLLLTYVAILNIISLALFFLSLQTLFRNKLISFFGILFISSTPLFIGISHQFFTEPLHILCVTWVIYIMVHFKNWPPLKTWVTVIIAASLTVLVKNSALLYILFPVLYVCLGLTGPAWIRTKLRVRKNNKEWSFLHAVIGLMTTLSVVIATIAWLKLNIVRVWQYTENYSFVDCGMRRGYFGKIFFWIKTLQVNYFDSVFFAITIILLITGAVVYAVKNKPRFDSENIFSILALFQITFILFCLCLITNEDAKYLFALLPYAGLAVCSALDTLRRWRGEVAVLFIMIFMIQYAMVYSRYFGFSKWREYNMHSRPITYFRETELLKDIIAVLPEDQRGVCIVGGYYRGIHARVIEYSRLKESGHADYKTAYENIAWRVKYSGRKYSDDQIAQIVLGDNPIRIIIFKNEYYSILPFLKRSGRYSVLNEFKNGDVLILGPTA